MNDTLTPINEAEKVSGDDEGSAASATEAGSEAGADKSEGGRAHNDDAKAASVEAGGALAALKKSLLSVYGSAQAAFEALSSSDRVVGRKQWKRAIKKAELSEDFGNKDLKALRSSLPKVTSLSEFCRFLGESLVQDVSPTESADASGLAPLPPEVPSLPSSFRRREHAQAQLTEALLHGDGKRSTSLTAPKSRVSSQG